MLIKLFTCGKRSSLQLPSGPQRAEGDPVSRGWGCVPRWTEMHTQTHTHSLSHSHVICYPICTVTKLPVTPGPWGGGDTQTQSNNYTHTHTKVSNTLYCVYTHTHSRGVPSVPSEVQTTVVLSGRPHCSSRAQTLVARHIASRVNGAVDNIPSVIYFSKKEKKS